MYNATYILRQKPSVKDTSLQWRKSLGPTVSGLEGLHCITINMLHNVNTMDVRHDSGESFM